MPNKARALSLTLMAASSSPPPSSLSHSNINDVSNPSQALTETVAQSLLACPEELITEILSYGCAGPLDYTNAELLRSNVDRARAPFVASAVCQRWRAIALSSAVLWHYLTIPQITFDNEPSKIEQLTGYVNTVLERSRDGAVDVIIQFLAESLQTMELLEPVFLALEQSSHRWRRFSIVMYGKPTVTRILALFSQPTPNLRTLELARQFSAAGSTLGIDSNILETADTSHDTISFDRPFLPDTSALSAVTLVNVPQVVHRWPMEIKPRATFYTLQIVQSTLSTETWDLFARQCSNMAWLLLDTLSVAHSDPSPQLVFPNLEMLWICRAAQDLLSPHSGTLETPVLCKIVMDGGLLSPFADLAYRIRGHLRHIDLRRLDVFDQAEIDVLATLEHLQVMQLSGPMQVPAALLRLMRRTEPSHAENQKSQVLWPRLGWFELYSASFDGVEDTGDSETLLVQVARIRGREGPLDKHGVPRWVRMNYAFVGSCLVSDDQVEEMRSVGAEVEVG